VSHSQHLLILSSRRHKWANLSESLQDRIIRCLRLVVSVEEERGAAGAPGVDIADTPRRDRNTSRNGKAGFHNCRVIAGRGSSNVEFGDCNFSTGSGESDIQIDEIRP